MQDKSLALAGGLFAGVASSCMWLKEGWQRWCERRQLQRIDLYDISLSRRADIEQELDKPWWRE